MKELTTTVAGFLNMLDYEMKQPSDAGRGRRIASLCNTLDMANDQAMRYGLGLSFKQIERFKVSDRNAVNLGDPQHG